MKIESDGDKDHGDEYYKFSYNNGPLNTMARYMDKIGGGDYHTQTFNINQPEMISGHPRNRYSEERQSRPMGSQIHSNVSYIQPQVMRSHQPVMQMQHSQPVQYIEKPVYIEKSVAQPIYVSGYDARPRLGRQCSM